MRHWVRCQCGQVSRWGDLAGFLQRLGSWAGRRQGWSEGSEQRDHSLVKETVSVISTLLQGQPIKVPN